MRLFQAEFKRLLRRRVLWVLLAFAVPVPVLFGPGTTGWSSEDYSWNSMGLVFLSATMAASVSLVLGGTYWGADFRHGTIATLLTFVPDRTRVWVARMGVLLVASLGFGVICLAAAFSMVYVATGGTLGRINDVDTVGTNIAIGLGLCVMSAFFGAFLVIIFKSTVAAVIAPLVYGFVRLITAGYTTSSTTGYGGRLMLLLPDTYLIAYLKGGGAVRYTLAEDHSRYGEYYITLGLATTVLVLCLAALGTLSLVLFNRRSVAE